MNDVFCGRCHMAIGDQDKFCKYCGADQSGPSAPPVTQMPLVVPTMTGPTRRTTAICGTLCIVMLLAGFWAGLVRGRNGAESATSGTPPYSTGPTAQQGMPISVKELRSGAIQLDGKAVTVRGVVVDCTTDENPNPPYIIIADSFSEYRGTALNSLWWSSHRKNTGDISVKIQPVPVGVDFHEVIVVDGTYDAVANTLRLTAFRRAGWEPGWPR